MKITNPITLDVARSNSYICLLAKQFDENSRFLIATLTNNGEPMIIPAGAAVTLRATRPDGEPVAVPGIINNDGTTTVEIDDYILEVVGSASLSIEVAIGDEILTSASFNLTIQRADGNGWLRVYVAAASLAAGNYYITIGDTPYAFTTTQAIPAGGSVYFASEGGTAQTRDASGNVLDASLPVSIASTGTELTSDVPTMSFLTAIAGRMATIEAEMPQKADIDGSYPLFHAGTADNLMTNNGATQAIPFIQEGTGKGNGEATVKAGGVLQLKKKLGNTVGVNQLVPDAHSIAAGTYNWNGVFGTSLSGKELIKDHYYLIFVDTPELVIRWRNESLGLVGANGRYVVYKPTTTDNHYYVQANGTLTGTAHLKWSDLTLWFGSNDRIPADLIAHPENWGRYYAGSLAYNAGTLESADGTVMRSLPRNMFDRSKETVGKKFNASGQLENNVTFSVSDYIEVSPNSDIYFLNVARAAATYAYAEFDAQKNFIKVVTIGGGSGNTTSGNKAVSSNCHFIRICYESAQTEVGVSLYYPGESGYDQYYPFSALAEVDTGSEVLRSAGAVADEKTPDGTITRKVGVVDLGTLTWGTSSTDTAGYNRFISSTNIGGASTPTGTRGNVMSAKYCAINGNEAYTKVTGVTLSSNGNVVVYDSALAQGTAAAFKTAMSGVYLYYELATPTTEQGTAYAENIPCDDFGSMYWTQTKGIPQGNEIFYPDDLKGALESIVAALPSANGTYTLHATVTTAGVTFSWS